jgi:hypothetical protein
VHDVVVSVAEAFISYLFGHVLRGNKVVW